VEVENVMLPKTLVPPNEQANRVVSRGLYWILHRLGTRKRSFREF